MKHFYRMKENGGAAIRIDTPLDAPEWNKKGYGIFWTIHEFTEARKKEHLEQINGFAIDIDTGDKRSAMQKIKKGLLPTWVIETKNGYHVYWLFKNPLVVKHNENLELEYKAVVVNRLIPFYGADKNATDICRLLRAPYFLHLKDPKDPFMVKPISETESLYDWSQVARFYPDEIANTVLEKQEKQAIKTLKLGGKGKEFFQKIGEMNCEDALAQLSGHASVDGERYTFRRNASGTKNILVDGKSTSCWVDKDGKIGSLDKGGPTIWQWLFWYQRDHKKVFKTMKEVFGV